MKEDKLKKYADYRFELWSLLAEKSCIVLESELDEIQYLVLKNREYIEEFNLESINDNVLPTPDGLKKLIVKIVQERI